MVNYLEILSAWMDQPHLLLVILILMYFVSATIDFGVGTINAVYTKNIKYSSKTAQLGIIRKLTILMVMVLVVPLALILPKDFGVYSLSFLYVGIVSSEIYSILAHIGIVKDGDKSKNIIGTLFAKFLESVFAVFNNNNNKNNQG